MKRDAFGICISPALLSRNLSSTFTHIRGYETREQQDTTVKLAFQQLSGEQLLNTVESNTELLWRAEYCCTLDK
ncbi:hypothetical protein M1D72_15055 [Vibrio sp. AK197]|uniref:Cation transporter n=1 Tax=Vibrio olivae TaxID=1243002 RepID=A0ABV5HKH9_9VIBR